MNARQPNERPEAQATLHLTAPTPPSARRVTVLMALALVATLAASRAGAATVDVTVTITSVRNISAGDAFFGAPDFFARIFIDSASSATPTVFNSQGFVGPAGWSFTRTFSRARTGLIPIRIELWDRDSPFDPAGVDIDPATCSGSALDDGCAYLSLGRPAPADTYGLDLTLDPRDGSWMGADSAGDSNGSASDCTTGAEPSAANMCFTITVSAPRPEELVVTTTLDSSRTRCGLDACGLREAVTAAESGDTIVLPASAVPYDLTLDARLVEPANPSRGSHLAVAQSPLTIRGPTTGGTAVIRQTRPDSRVFDVHASGDLRLSYVTVTSGAAGDSSTAFPSHIHGGGIHNHGYLDLRNVTVTGNRATDSSRPGIGGGGGIYNASSGFANLMSVTIADNVTVEGLDDNFRPLGPLGGGIAGPGIYWLRNTVISGNTQMDGPSTNCQTTNVLDWGGNLQYPGTDCVAIAVFRPGAGPAPLRTAGGNPLTPLRANFTYAPVAGGAAVDGGDGQNCQDPDQAGGRAPLDGDWDGTALCDAGAIELDTGSFGTIEVPRAPLDYRRAP